jgi:hypothetical protein
MTSCGTSKRMPSPLHGLGNPDQEDLLLNGLLPELRKRSLLDTDYLAGDFRANLQLPKPWAIHGEEAVARQVNGR